MSALLFLLACGDLRPAENHGWKEIDPPRPDLQCWVRWNDSKTAVCVPSLNSTHGAGQ